MDTQINSAQVSVIIPCRNEEKFIGKCLDTIIDQDYSTDSIEILVIDGFSDDGTRRILNEYIQKYPFIKLLDNPGRIVPTALNIGIKNAGGEIIIRMDVHTEYANDYISQCVLVLEETGAENVGGPWVPKGKTYLQEAVAIAFTSRFSSGGAASHNLNHEGLVDSVYLGCWRKSTLKSIGLFDEELVRNQDDELNLRLNRAGGRIWQSPRIKSRYYPRASIKHLFKQYMQYGYWKVQVIQKHKLVISIRHIVPGMFVGLIGLLSLLSLVSSLAFELLIGIIALYGIANLGALFLTCKRIENWKYIPVMPVIFSAYHLGYGYGFLRGILDFVIFKRRASKTFTRLTRSARVERND